MEQMEQLKSTIKIIEYKFEENYLQKYLDFFEELYKENHYRDYNKKVIKKLLSKENPFFKENRIWNYLCLKDNKVVGHISAIIDSRLYKKSKTGMIGFFECIDDPEVSKKLFNKAINKLKENQCIKIIAPINLTLWHLYRFTIYQEEPFCFEPLTKKYYEKLILNQGFKISEEY